MNTLTHKTINVLMVEDEPGDAEYLRWMLKDVPDSSFELECVDRLAAALDHLQTTPTHVVLLDLTLPDSHGIETLTKLRRQAAHIPVVVLTGLNDEDMAMEALRNGAQDYLVKGSIDSNLLARAVRYSLGRKQVEEELLRSQEQLRRAQKMEALGRLAGGIAHDFNNMLTSILGLGRFTLAQLGEDHPCHGDVTEIIRTGQRAAALTRQLLALTEERTTTQLQPLDLNRIIRDMHQLFRRTIGENIEIVTVFGEDLRRIHADVGQMEQVIMNVAVNARDAMPGGGTLTIKTANVTLDDNFCAMHKGLTPGEYVLLAMRDTGCGMPPEVAEKAFDPFFTTKAKDKGSGLGLSTAYGIVRHFGGRIELDSRPNAGTSVLVYLPCVDAPEPVVSEESESALPRGTEMVLVVEDDDTIRHLVARMLKDLGYDIMTARHGGAALEICAGFTGTLHLVISDVVMPHVDGPELLKRLSQVRNDFKALFMSGYTDGRVAESEPAYSETPVLAKPFSKEELAMKVREVLDGKEKLET